MEPVRAIVVAAPAVPTLAAHLGFGVTATAAAAVAATPASAGTATAAAASAASAAAAKASAAPPSPLAAAAASFVAAPSHRAIGAPASSASSGSSAGTGAGARVEDALPAAARRRFGGATQFPPAAHDSVEEYESREVIAALALSAEKIRANGDEVPPSFGTALCGLSNVRRMASDVSSVVDARVSRALGLQVAAVYRGDKPEPAPAPSGRRQRWRRQRERQPKQGGRCACEGSRRAGLGGCIGQGARGTLAR
jgi:hypothetical protein